MACLHVHNCNVLSQPQGVLTSTWRQSCNVQVIGTPAVQQHLAELLATAAPPLVADVAAAVTLLLCRTRTPSPVPAAARAAARRLAAALPSDAAAAHLLAAEDVAHKAQEEGYRAAAQGWPTEWADFREIPTAPKSGDLARDSQDPFLFRADGADRFLDCDVRRPLSPPLPRCLVLHTPLLHRNKAHLVPR